MNKILKQQLDKLKVAKVDSYNELTHTYVFKKHESATFKLDSVYLLRLDDKLLNPKYNDVLISNWNNGKYPTHTILKAQVSKKLGNMLFLCGVYCNEDKEPINEFWNGWLPDDQLKIIEEVK